MKVICVQQHLKSVPVEIVWTGKAEPADDVSVMLAVAQLLQHAKNDTPWAPKILEIRIEL